MISFRVPEILSEIVTHWKHIAEVALTQCPFSVKKARPFWVEAVERTQEMAKRVATVLCQAFCLIFLDAALPSELGYKNVNLLDDRGNFEQIGSFHRIRTRRPSQEMGVPTIFVWKGIEDAEDGGA